MPTHLRLACAGVLSTVLLSTGCANKQKAELYLVLDANTRNPAFQQAMERVDLAQTLALMNLDHAMAVDLKRWSDSDGKAVREKIELDWQRLGQACPKFCRASAGLLQRNLTTPQQQEAYLKRALGDQDKLRAAGPQTLNFEQVLGEHAAGLEKLSDRLTDRQQLVVLGSWKQVSDSVTAVVQLPPNSDADAANAKREEAVGALTQARHLERGLSEAERAKLDQVLGGVVPGQTADTEVERVVTTLFGALPAQDPGRQLRESVSTLAAMLAQAPAADLLAIVCRARRPAGA